MGWDGLSTLLLSFAVAAASGGTALLVCWVLVSRAARGPRAEPRDADIVVVFGAPLDGAGRPGAEFEGRLRRARRICRDRPLMIVGGATGPGAESEAGSGSSWLREQGWSGRPVIVETRSRNTVENLYHARAALRRGGFAKPALVSNRYHLARLSLLAAGFGMAHELCAVEESPGIGRRNFPKSLKEAAMINWYFVARGWARLTGNTGILARIT